MKTFLTWFNNAPKDLDGLLRAGLAHAWFEVVHPYEDGNGRVGRALLDRALAQDENRSTRLYSMSARFESERDAYYDALGAFSTGTMDVTPWLQWFLVQIEAAAKSSEHTVNRVALESAVLGAQRGGDPQRATEEGAQRLARCRTTRFRRRNDE